MSNNVTNNWVEEINNKIDMIAKDCKYLSKKTFINPEIIKHRPTSAPPGDTTNKELSSFIRSGNKEGISLNVKSLTTSEDSAGVVIVSELYREIINKIKAINPMRQLASVETISSSSLDVIMEDGSFSGVWASEEQEREVTQEANLKKKKIFAHELYAQPKASSMLLADAAVNIESWLTDRLRDSFARAESDAFINGDGVGKPIGIIPACSENAIEIDEINSDNMIYFINEISQIYRPGASMLMHSSTLSEIQKIKDGIGNLLSYPSLSGNSYSIFGIPVYCCDYMPSFEDKQNIIALGNFKSAYKIVDRKGISVMRDPYTEKPFVKFYATRRVGADVINHNAIRLMSLK